jgi:hypothetical protein
MKLRRLATLAAGTFFACPFSLVFPLFFTVPVQGQSCSQSDLDKLPVPLVMPPSHRVVQLINCSGVEMLGATNAAGLQQVPVLPREGTWVMQPYGTTDQQGHLPYILTIDIPPEWENTNGKGTNGPNIWARTGCRYDPTASRTKVPDGLGIAQCETGGSGGVYDTSKAKKGPPGGTTITEWTFYKPDSNHPDYFTDGFDISAVNGVSLTVDIQGVGGSPDNKYSCDPWWLSKNYPLSAHGVDLRGSNLCPNSSRLMRSDLTPENKHNPSWPYGFVIVDKNGMPESYTYQGKKWGDTVVGCFSNCGKYEFPSVPNPNCDPKTDPTCYAWTVFCSKTNPDNPQKCPMGKDSECDLNFACWINPGSDTDHTCQPRGFIQKKACAGDVCTFPYGFPNNCFKPPKPDDAGQPPFGRCKDVISGAPKGPKQPPVVCIGDDTVHGVMPHAYSWPSDAQSYSFDAPVYRILFAPGGTDVPIAPSVGPKLPLCSSLPSIYNYATWGLPNGLCSGPINNGAKYGIALPKDAPNPSWQCDLSTETGDNGVICQWKAD